MGPPMGGFDAPEFFPLSASLVQGDPIPFAGTVWITRLWLDWDTSVWTYTKEKFVAFIRNEGYNGIGTGASRNGATMAVTPVEIYCPECRAKRPHKNGILSARQLYKCRECRRQFGGGQYPSGDRFPEIVKADAVRHSYLGMTCREAANYVIRQHAIRDTEIAPSTVMRWVHKCTDAAIRAAEGVKTTTGNTWTIDHSSAVDLGASCWQVLDNGSGYLLAVDYYPRTDEVLLSEVIKNAIAAAESAPQLLFSRCSFGTCSSDASIVSAIRDAFPEIEVRLSDEIADLSPTVYGPDGSKYKGKAPANKFSRLKSPASVRSYFHGWAVSYNFIEYKQDGRPPPGLTVVADPPFSSWVDVIGLVLQLRIKDIE